MSIFHSYGDWWHLGGFIDLIRLKIGTDRGVLAVRIHAAFSMTLMSDIYATIFMHRHAATGALSCAAWVYPGLRFMSRRGRSCSRLLPRLAVFIEGPYCTSRMCRLSSVSHSPYKLCVYLTKRIATFTIVTSEGQNFQWFTFVCHCLLF